MLRSLLMALLSLAIIPSLFGALLIGWAGWQFRGMTRDLTQPDLVKAISERPADFVEAVHAARASALQLAEAVRAVGSAGSRVALFLLLVAGIAALLPPRSKRMYLSVLLPLLLAQFLCLGTLAFGMFRVSELQPKMDDPIVAQSEVILRELGAAFSSISVHSVGAVLLALLLVLLLGRAFVAALRAIRSA